MEAPAARVAPSDIFATLGATVPFLRERFEELLELGKACVSLGNAHRDRQSDDVSVLVVLAASKLDRQHVGLPQRHKHELPVSGSEHRPRIEGVDEPGPGYRGELESIFDGAVNEGLQVDRL